MNLQYEYYEYIFATHTDTVCTVSYGMGREFCTVQTYSRGYECSYLVVTSIECYSYLVVLPLPYKTVHCKIVRMSSVLTVSVSQS